MSAATMNILHPSFAAQNIMKFCVDPGPVHWQAAVKALQYFWQTKNLGVTYGEVSSRDVIMSAYVNYDHVTCPDSRRSVSGRAAMLCLGAISRFCTECNSAGSFRVRVCSACGSRE